MYQVNTLDRSEVGQTFRRRLGNDEKSLNLPRKSIQRGKLQEGDQLSGSVFGANEFYKEVDSTSLKNARDDGHEDIIRDLEYQTDKSEPGEFDFTFLNYTDSNRITKIEAYQMVGILARYSDYLTTPI
jgi:hypothetical protein